MTEEEYTNLDLDTAKALLIAAGQPDIARALQYQSDGVRNLVQGEWGRSFVNTLDNIMETRVVNVLASVQLRLDEQIGLVQQLITMVRAANTTADEALSVAKEVRRGLGKSQTDIADLTLRVERGELERADAQTRLTQLEAVNERLDRVEQVMAARPALREAEYRAIAERAAEEAIRRLEARGDGER